MAATTPSSNPFTGIIIRESADDGSDFANPSADYRRLFLGEDGALHLKDSAGAVTDVAGAAADITTDAAWTTAGDQVVGTGDDTAAIVPVGDEGDIWTVASGVPAWEAPTAGGIPAARAWLTDDYRADDYPPSPNATYDDEFNDETGMSGATNGLDARWNWRNQSTASVAFTKAGWMTLSIPSGTVNFRILEITAFADGTYEMHMSAENAQTNDTNQGIVLVDDVNGDFYFFGRCQNGSLVPGLTLQRWNSVTSWNSNVAAVSDFTPTSVYLRVTKSGSDLRMWWSTDGLGWQALTATFSDAVGATRIGIGCNETNSTGLTKLHVDYFRKTA